MKSLPTSFVLDASVGIKLVKEEEDSDVLAKLLVMVDQDPASRIVVPRLFHIECGNILWKLVRRGDATARDAKQNLSLLMAMAFDVLDDAIVLQDALRLAIDRDTTVYDSIYVCTAKYCGLPLLTADDRLRNKLPKRGTKTFSLDEISHLL